MRKSLTILLLLLATGVIFASGGMRPERWWLPAEETTSTADPAPQSPKPQGDRRIIDLKSDLSGPVAPGDSVIFLVGNFAAQHNGAVITCDSAVRYSDKRIKFFGNVLINKNTTYIYGDRADYNGELNEARVYSDIIKVVDGDATLYTYRFSFNTLDNIGEFGDGGVMINRDNQLEAVRGYYYADSKNLICVDRVEMRNDEYELRGDSVVYNMESDDAYFFTATNIWNRDGDYLYADRGAYRKADTLYRVTLNGYILTEKQEVWSDSIDYYRNHGHAILRHDIQLDDTEHKVLAFGDYGEYWQHPGDAFLTRNPAIISYDKSQGDSLFMRSDSIYLYTVDRFAVEADTTSGFNYPDGADMPAGMRAPDEGGEGEEPFGEAVVDDGTMPQGAPAAKGTPARAPRRAAEQGDADKTADAGAAPQPADTLSQRGAPHGVDSLQHADSLPPVNPLDTMTVSQRKAYLKALAQQEVARKRAEAAAVKKERLRQIAAARREKNTARLLKAKEQEERRLKIQQIKESKRFQQRYDRALRKGKPLPVDSAALKRIEAELKRNRAFQDSLHAALVQAWEVDSTEMSKLDTLPEPWIPVDSIYRLIKGFRNVRIYRSDFQAVCDSITAISTDSTIHLYIKPVLWNGSNQITSEWMDIYTEHQQLLRAEFKGDPLMVGKIDTTYYNQISGKEMTAYFRDNKIWLNNVNVNARTLYYNQDGEPPQITGLFYVESGGINFYIDENEVVRMTWLNSPVYHIYPMDKIPSEQKLYLDGFSWEGDRRPEQQDVFSGRVRPSERERVRQLEHPTFPLRFRLDDHRRRLLETHHWIDRTDEVDEQTVEWMHSLGYEVGQPRNQ